MANRQQASIPVPMGACATPWEATVAHNLEDEAGNPLTPTKVRVQAVVIEDNDGNEVPLPAGVAAVTNFDDTDIEVQLPPQGEWDDDPLDATVYVYVERVHPIIGEDDNRPNAPQQVDRGLVPGAYGEMYSIDSASVIAIALLDAWAAIDDMTAGETKDFAFDGVADDLECERAGTYLVHANLSGQFDAAALKQGEVCIAIDGTPVEKTRRAFNYDGNQQDTFVQCFGILDLAAGHKLTVMVRNRTDATDFNLEAAGLAVIAE
ncbi:MAG: hypothetical protein K0U84_14060 [Actinomycetia bacterium]|nr:hypothetical protein [Actinomycetes bacterium]